MACVHNLIGPQAGNLSHPHINNKQGGRNWSSFSSDSGSSACPDASSMQALADAPDRILVTQTWAASTLQKCLDFDPHHCGTRTPTHSPNRIQWTKSRGVPGPSQTDFCVEGSGSLGLYPSHSQGLVFHIDILWEFYHGLQWEQSLGNDEHFRKPNTYCLKKMHICHIYKEN